ncbi:MAG: cold shock domain-containing protein CspD [Pseudomonadales bacterium]
MATGKVKWFNNAKGYGFILPEHGGEDLFAHYSSIQMDGYKTLKAGQDVEYDLLEGPKGNHAVNIRMADGLLVDGYALPSQTQSPAANGGAENGFEAEFAEGAEAPEGASAVHHD